MVGRGTSSQLRQFASGGPQLEKVPTGVAGLDEVLDGGFPRGRPTLVCGGAGCGKTLLGMQFLCRGALDLGEPGLFVSFEESERDLTENVASLGFNLDQMESDDLIRLDYVHIAGREIVETGEYDLDGLLIRIDAAVREIGATRIVIDTVEVLFGALSDAGLVRAELQRLFGWLKERGLTALITAEQGKGGDISRHGIEEYVSDCVLVLDHRVTEELSTRRLRVMKYRGSVHGTNEYPFLISRRGITVLPITSLSLDQQVASDRVGTGIDRFDAMLSGGVYRASSILISGTPGTGKTTFAATFAAAACARGEQTLYISYEEPPSQLVRNMASVGLELQRWIDDGSLRLEALRPTLYGLESHLAHLQELLDDVEPLVVVIDPISSVLRAGTPHQASGIVTRELDLLKRRGITTVLTALTHPARATTAQLEVSSLIDTWVEAMTVESHGEHNRILQVVKSRGMAHSNQLTEFVLTDQGIEILEPYVGPAGMLMGTARVRQQNADEATQDSRRRELEQRTTALNLRRAAVEAEVARLYADLAADEQLTGRFVAEYDQDAARESATSDTVGRLRWASPDDETTEGIRP